MTQGETIISILLALIVYFLYHIARQLSYLTGKRLRLSFPFSNLQNYKPTLPRKTQVKKEPPEKLTN